MPFVIDSGVLEDPGGTGDFNIEQNGWSKSFVAGEDDPFDDGNGPELIAGTIAAKVNGKGVIVAPGAGYSLKVLTLQVEVQATQQYSVPVNMLQKLSSRMNFRLKNA